MCFLAISCRMVRERLAHGGGDKGIEGRLHGSVSWRFCVNHSNHSRGMPLTKPTRMSLAVSPRSASPDESVLPSSLRAVLMICDKSGMSPGPWCQIITVNTHEIVHRSEMLVENDNDMPAIRTQSLLLECDKDGQVVVVEDDSMSRDMYFSLCCKSRGRWREHGGSSTSEIRSGCPCR